MPVLWRIDVPGRRIEVLSGPTSEGTWRHTTTLAEDDGIAIPELGAQWRVAELLP